MTRCGMGGCVPRSGVFAARVAEMLLSLLPCGVYGAQEVLEKEESVSFSGSLDVAVASGYLTSSGSLYDTRPVTTQCLKGRVDFADGWYMDGYAWFISTLHNMQRESHRVFMNEFEGAVFFGRSWRFSGDMVLDTKAGPLWNPPIGYKDAHRNCWGPYVVQSLENPYVTPYWAGLWIMQPQQRGRVRMGLRRRFAVCESVSIVPYIETVWMDRRRFASRYGADPEKDGAFGGAFTAVTTAVRGTWRFARDWTAYAALMQFDIVNTQARRAVKRSDTYWAKCDWPVVRIGVEYSF